MSETSNSGAPIAAPGVVVDATTITPILTSLVRQALTAGGGMLVAKGLVTPEQDNQLITLGVGLVSVGVSIAWSAIQKRMAAKRLVSAAAADPKTVTVLR